MWRFDYHSRKLTRQNRNSERKNFSEKISVQSKKKKTEIVHPAQRVTVYNSTSRANHTHKRYASHNTRNNQPTDIWLGRRKGDDTTESEVLSDLSSSGSF